MTHQQQTAFENIVGKGEIARNEQFLLFPQCFQLNQLTVPPFVRIFDIISLFAFELEEPKIGVSGKGIKENNRLVSEMDQVFRARRRNLLGEPKANLINSAAEPKKLDPFQTLTYYSIYPVTQRDRRRWGSPEETKFLNFAVDRSGRGFTMQENSSADKGYKNSS